MSEHQINIETIIDSMNNNFEQFDKDYLHHEFFYDVKFHLEENNVPASVPFTKENKEYFYDYVERYRQDSINSINYVNYPFPVYYLRKYERDNEKIVDIVELDTYCIVEKENKNFDLFFAYQLALTDIMEINNFLGFHLKETYENNFIEFESFMLSILIKYKAFLEEKHKPLVEYFLKNNELTKSIELSKINNKDFTTSRQVLAIKYLLDTVSDRMNNIDKTEIARFIQFLTGREADNSVIKNTPIYKKVSKPFSKKDKKLENDLQFIRPFFEKLGLESIVNQINIEITKKE